MITHSGNHMKTCCRVRESFDHPFAPTQRSVLHSALILQTGPKALVATFSYNSDPLALRLPVGPRLRSAAMRMTRAYQVGDAMVSFNRHGFRHSASIKKTNGETYPSDRS